MNVLQIGYEIIKYWKKVDSAAFFVRFGSCKKLGSDHFGFNITS
jgi:hypothetical protein